MKNLPFLVLIFVSCKRPQQPDTLVSKATSNQEIVREQTNSHIQMKKPYVVIISLDGFRYDYAEKYNATHLLNFKVKAEKMIPSFPSKTFPNHYAIATGLYPGNNGLVSNEFYDRSLNSEYSPENRKAVENASFYNGTPLWVLASEQNMVTASMFWVGSETPIKGVTPTYSYKYNGKISYNDRVNQVVQWLKLPEEKRPHLITLYFSITDDIGHKFGPNSEEIKQAVKEIDETIGDLSEKINKLNLPVNIIVVSDHGMLEVNTDDLIYPEKLFPSKFKVTRSFPAMIYSDDSIAIDSLYQSLVKDTTQYSVYYKNNLPVRFHYNSNDDRVGDLVVMPKPPFSFGRLNSTVNEGASTHGYDPAVTPQMGAIFYATGPAFKKATIPAFENVNVYPLVAQILGLEYNKKAIDGNIEVLEPILK